MSQKLKIMSILKTLMKIMNNVSNHMPARCLKIDPKFNNTDERPGSQLEPCLKQC